MGTLHIRNKAISPTRNKAFIDKIKGYLSPSLDFDDIQDAINELKGCEENTFNGELTSFVCVGDEDTNGDRWDMIYTLSGWTDGDIEHIRTRVREYNEAE